MNKAKATSFATLKDLRGYIVCLLAGGSETHCYSKGDNGEGAWGDITAQLHTPYVALPESVAVHNKSVRVLLEMEGARPFYALCGDKGPDGVIDLNPAALQAAGLPTDTELDCPAHWEWSEQTPETE